MFSKRAPIYEPPAKVKKEDCGCTKKRRIEREATIKKSTQPKVKGGRFV